MRKLSASLKQPLKISLWLSVVVLLIVQTTAMGQTSTIASTEIVFASSGDGFGPIEARCPVGKVAVGGGAFGGSSGASSAPADRDLTIAPISTGEPTAWWGEDQVGKTNEEGPLDVYVVCTSLTGVNVVRAQSATAVPIEAACATGFNATGGGAVGFKTAGNGAPAASGGAVEPITTGTPTAWYGEDPSGVTNNQFPLSVYVVCAPIATTVATASESKSDPVEAACPVGSPIATGGGALGKSGQSNNTPALNGGLAEPVTTGQPNAWLATDRTGFVNELGPLVAYVVCTAAPAATTTTTSTTTTTVPTTTTTSSTTTTTVPTTTTTSSTTTTTRPATTTTSTTVPSTTTTSTTLPSTTTTSTTLPSTTTTVSSSTLCAGKVPTRVGTNGADVLIGTSGADVISGLGGFDRIVGGEGNDTICAGSGDDVVVSDGGSDSVYGEGGNDRLDGGNGSDLVNGGTGTDRCVGGETYVSCEFNAQTGARMQTAGSGQATGLESGGGQDPASDSGAPATRSIFQRFLDLLASLRSRF